MKYQERFLSMGLLMSAIAVAFALNGCGKAADSSSGTATEDSSASGAVAGAVGGALSGSSSSGTQAFLFPKEKATMMASVRQFLDFLPSSYALPLCPKPKSASGCTASGSTMWLDYSACTFGAGVLQWNGVLAVELSSGTAACGSFPPLPSNGTLTRQYVAGVTGASGTTPGSLTLTNIASGKTGTIDDATANLANFDGDTIAAIANGGYGAQVAFTNGVRSSVTIGHHISVTGAYDHSVTGQLTLAETAGSSSRTVSGTVKVYHNLLKVIGTSTFNNVTHSDTCCLPTAGSITTAFAAGANVSPTAAGSKLVGQSETLTFTGCGTATLLATDGTTSSVTLNRCF